MMDEEKRLQVADQCKVVAHLATVLADLHRIKGRDIRAGRADRILDIIGERSAAIMESLGDMLNGMDAVSDEDQWVHPIFKRAQERFPRRPG